MKNKLFSIIISVFMMFGSVTASAEIVTDSYSDRVVNLKDMMHMLNLINNPNSEISDSEMLLVDVYRDSNFNVKDVLKMAQFLAGWKNVVLGE